MAEKIVDRRYKLVRQLGRGGMGVVHETIDLRSGRRVAVKLLAKSVGEEIPDVLARFEREVRATCQLDSENIVKVYDAGTDSASNAPYMVMELVGGHDLQHWFRALKQLRPEAVVKIAGQVALGLAKAHEAGVVHRDIKPANVLLADGGGELTAKILDFGIAKLKMEQVQGDTGLTKTGSMLGSPHYMSPEQAQGLKSIDHRTDIWSLGVLMYKALTGRTPFAQLESVGQVIIAIWSFPIPPVQDHAPWVSPELAAVVHKALEKKPEARFQTAAEMAGALRKLSPDGGFRAASTLLAPLTAEEQAVVAPRFEPSPPEPPAPLGGGSSRGLEPAVASVTRPAEPPARERSRGSAGALALGALGVLALGSGITLGLSYGRARPDEGRQAQAASVRQQPEPAPSAPPPAGPSASASAQASPADVRASLSVPAGATVLVDGEAARVESGAVELSGPAGSSRLVLVRLGRREASQSVLLTEQGARPPSIGLEALREKRGAPAGAKAEPQQPGSPPKVQPNPSNIDRTFE